MKGVATLAWTLVSLVSTMPPPYIGPNHRLTVPGEDFYPNNKKSAPQVGDITVELDALKQLGIDTDLILDHLKKLAEAQCGVKGTPYFEKHYLQNKTVTCNDGSPAG